MLSVIRKALLVRSPGPLAAYVLARKRRLKTSQAARRRAAASQTRARSAG